MATWIPVRCPKCGKRLIDVDADSEPRGTVAAFCRKQKLIVLVDLSIYKKIKEEPQKSEEA